MVEVGNFKKSLKKVVVAIELHPDQPAQGLHY